MITINANVDRTSLNKTIGRMAQFGKAEGLTVQFVCWDVMRAILLTMMQRTAPWADKNVVGTYAAQKKTGEGAVSHDIDRVFNDAEDCISFDNNGKKFVRVKSKGWVFPINADQWNPSAWISSMKSRHVSLRNSNGRVPRQKYGSRMWVRASAINEYKDDVKSRVGSLKAGWLPAIRHYARLCRGSVGRGYGWVARQAIKSGGFGGIMQPDGNGTIYADNTAHHSRAIRKDTVERVISDNEKYLNKFSKFRIQRLCDQFNKGQVPKPILQAAA